MQPLISVIIPCYNLAEYLPAALKSLINQSFSNWECIIINDGSTDDTVAIAKKYIGTDKRFKLINKTNGGPASARNQGIKNSNGEYLIFLDGDDILLSGYMKCIEEKARELKSDILIAGYQILNPDLSLIQEIQPELGTHVFLNLLSYTAFAPCHAYVISRSIICKTGGFDETLNSSEDWDLWIRVAKISNSINILQTIGVGYRMTLNSRSRNGALFLDGVIEVLKRSRSADPRLNSEQGISKEPLTPGIINWLMVSCGIILFSERDEEAKKLFSEIVKEYSLSPQAEDFHNLFSYLFYSETSTLDKKKKFLIHHIERISLFIFYCEEVLQKNIFAAALRDIINTEFDLIDISLLADKEVDFKRIKSKTLFKELLKKIISRFKK